MLSQARAAPKTALQTRLWRERNREHHDQQHKNYSLQKTYGITIERYQEMLREQNSVCAFAARVRGLCVDHDHVTGKVRGLLCLRCNVLLELLEQNPQRVEKLRRYLKKHKAE